MTCRTLLASGPELRSRPKKPRPAVGQWRNKAIAPYALAQAGLMGDAAGATAALGEEIIARIVQEARGVLARLLENQQFTPPPRGSSWKLNGRYNRCG